MNTMKKLYLLKVLFLRNNLEFNFYSPNRKLFFFGADKFNWRNPNDVFGAQKFNGSKSIRLKHID